MEGGKWLMVALGAVATVTLLAVLAVTVAAGVVILDDGDERGEEPSAHAFGAGPVQAIVDLSASGKQRWRTALGEECNLDRIYGLALGYVRDHVDVVTFPGDCEVTRLRISPEDGAVRPEDPLTLPSR